MRRYLLSLVIGLGIIVMAGCGGSASSSTTTSTALTGTVAVFGKDSPLCNILSFQVQITDAELKPSGGGSSVQVISSANPVTVDFASLRDFSTLLNLSKVPAGTYSQITLTLGGAQLSYFDSTQGKVVTITPTFTSSTVTFQIDPALTVSGSGTTGLTLDFSLRRSVQFTSGGATVTPVFQVEPTPKPEDGIGEADDLHGDVQSVSTSSFVIQTDNMQTLTINVTSNTKFEDGNGSGLSGLSKGTFVEVDSFVDANNNIVAKEVQIGEQENQSSEQPAFVGVITSITQTDSSGNATQFQLFVREEHPDESSVVPEKSTLLVNLTSTTMFRTMASSEDFGSFQYGASSLAVGQSVVVSGQPTAGTPPTINAAGVFLRLESVLGNFSALAGTPGSDDKTGGFILTPCGALFFLSGAPAPITVLTNSNTEFEGVTGLKELTTTPTLVVKGLLYRNPSDTTVNGVTVSAGTVVLVAVKVHQLGVNE